MKHRILDSPDFAWSNDDGMLWESKKQLRVTNKLGQKVVNKIFISVRIGNGLGLLNQGIEFY